MLPLSIKEEIVTQYLYIDIFRNFKRYFNEESLEKDTKLLYDFSFGF